MAAGFLSRVDPDPGKDEAGRRLGSSVPGATQPVQTTAYVWGSGKPESVVCQEQCIATEAARRFARRAGWEEAAPTAWALEITLPLTLTEALRVLAPLFMADKSVEGWGLQLGGAPHPSSR